MDEPTDPGAMTRACVQCGTPFRPVPAHRKLCGDTCRRQRANARQRNVSDEARQRRVQRANLRKPVKPEPDPDEPRPPCGEINVGSDYTAAECEYLKRVDELRRTVKFPAATDYFRLARQVLLPGG